MKCASVYYSTLREYISNVFYRHFCCQQKEWREQRRRHAMQTDRLTISFINGFKCCVCLFFIYVCVFLCMCCVRMSMPLCQGAHEDKSNEWFVSTCLGVLKCLYNNCMSNSYNLSARHWGKIKRKHLKLHFFYFILLYMSVSVSGLFPQVGLKACKCRKENLFPYACMHAKVTRG